MRRRKSNGNGSHLPAIPEETPASLMNRDPAKYQLIVDALEKEGWSPGQISALYNVSAGTIRRIRSSLGPGACHVAIRHVASNMVESAQLLSARLVKEIDQIPPAQMASALGTLTDKIMLLVGAPTVRIEHSNKKVVTPQELQEMYNRLPQANAHDVTPHADTKPAPSHAHPLSQWVESAPDSSLELPPTAPPQ